MPNPMQQSMPPDMGGDPEAVLDAPEEPAGGTDVTIRRLPDGTFQVNGASFSTLEEALRGILEIFKSAPSDNTPQSHFRSGFKANKTEEY